MLTSTTINGIALDASGRASKSGSNLRKLKLMTEANKIVEKISRPGMNKMQRLRASFDYVKKQYTYYCCEHVAGRKRRGRVRLHDMGRAGERRLPHVRPHHV